ncbi:U3 snoRNP protein [Malassezia sp. CBS 17886]|nr:U3 snoRNP protein [Malassezia sp. CBS 17886]
MAPASTPDVWPWREKAMDDNGARFRYVSFHERLRDVTIDLSRESGASWGASRLAVAGLEPPAAAFATATTAPPSVQAASELAGTAFGAALREWSDLNLCLPFQRFYARAMPMAQSLVLLLHHRDEIAQLLDEALTLQEPSAWLAWDAVIDLMPRFAFDLGPEFLPVYPRLQTALLRASSLMDKNLVHGDEALAARIVERAFHSAAWVFRAVASLVLRAESAALLLESWAIVRPFLARGGRRMPVRETGGTAVLAGEGEEEGGEEGEDAEGERGGEDAEEEEVAEEATEADEHTEEEAAEGQEETNDSSAPRRTRSTFEPTESAHGAPKESAPAPALDSPEQADGRSQESTLTLRAPKAHTRRFAAEALAYLIRKAPAPKLDVLAPQMIDDAQHGGTALALGVASTWAHSCKGVGRSLQSRTPQLLQSLLVRAHDAAHAALVRSTGERVLIALAHHAHATQMEPVLEMLMQWTRARMAALRADRGADALGDVLAWLRAASCTRKGTRVADLAKGALFVLLRDLRGTLVWTAAHAAVLETYCTLLCLLVPVARIPDLTGPVSGTLAGMAAHTLGAPADFAVAWGAFDGVVRALAAPETPWTGFRAFVLPSVLDATAQLLRTAQADAALVLLADLAADGLLAHLRTAAPTTMSLRWAKQMRCTLSAALERLATHPTDLGALPAVHLAPLFPDAAGDSAAALVRALTALAPSAASHADVVGLLLGALVSTVREADACSETDAASTHAAALCEGPSSVFAVLLDTCADAHAVLPPLAELVELLPCTLLAAADVWERLRGTVLSADRALVLAALKLVARARTDGAERVAAQLVEVEETPLDVANVAARNVRLRQVQRAASDALSRTDWQLHMLVLYTLGTLKLNLKPVWAGSRGTLVALAAQTEDVWRASFRELQAVDGGEEGGRHSGGAGHAAGDAAEDAAGDAAGDAANDADAAFGNTLQDPVLRTRVDALHAQLPLAHAPPAAARVRAMLRSRGAADVRFDAAHYADEILGLYAQHAALPEQHSTPFVAHVLAHWGALVDEDAAAPSAVRAKRLQRLLAIFAQFRRPQAMAEAPEMHARFVALCAAPEASVQRDALQCLGTWQHVWLERHMATLEALLVPATFRDTLAQLDLAHDSDQFAGVSRDAVPVVVRILYGLMTSRRGLRTSGAGQQARRAAILRKLCESRAEDRALLVDLMLASFRDIAAVPAAEHATPHASVRKQNGMLALLGDVLRELGHVLAPEMARLTTVVVHLARHATAVVGAGSADVAYRSVRRTALRRLADAVRMCDAPDWSAFRAPILVHLVHPRLAALATEGVQATSALLDLVRAWSTRRDTALCFLGDAAVLPAVYACLANAGVKPPVVHAVLDTAERVLAHADDAQVRACIVDPHVGALLHNMVPLVQHTIQSSFAHALSAHTRDELLRREIALLAMLAPFMQSSVDAAHVVELLVPLMRHSARAVPEKTRIELLRTFEQLLPRTQLRGPAFAQLYALFCRMGAELRTRFGRTAYAAAFAQLARVDPSLARVADWVLALNAYSTHTLDELDVERHLGASDTVLDAGTALTAAEWHALLYNALFFAAHPDEPVLRTSGAAVLQRFVRDVAGARVAPCADHPAALELATRVFLPGVRLRLRSRTEAVRKEMFSVFGLAVAELHPQLPSLAELTVLLAGGDVEASVFANLFHIQAHRRVRALHRLGEYAASLRSRTLSEFILPLVCFFWEPGASGGIDMNMANEALACMRRVAAHLRWSHYYHWLVRFLRAMKEHGAKEEASAAERVHIRGVVGLLEAFDMGRLRGDAGDGRGGDGGGASRDTEPADDAPDTPDQPDASRADAPPDTRDSSLYAHAAEPITAVVTTRILPQLHAALATQDEARLPARLPLLVGAARLAIHLPPDRGDAELLKVYAGVGAALRSKLQSTRDATREMALQMLRAIGARRLPVLVHELRRALTRGPQLAVCAYTVHALLVALGTPSAPGAAPLLKEVDVGMRDMVEAAVEDVFGLTSEDRDTVEYRTRVRELRQSKSVDTFEHLARLAHPARMLELLAPMRGVLAASAAPKTLQAADECLRRIAAGVYKNEHLDAGAFLVLCHTLIARGEAALGSRPNRRARDAKRARTPGMEAAAAAAARVAVLPTRHAAEAHGAVHQDLLAQNAHMFVCLGLDMLTTALRRGRFDVHDRATTAKLMPLVGVVGETLYARQAGVVERGLRCAAALARCPLPNLPEAMPVVQRQMLLILRHAGGLRSSVAQASARALAVVLRDCRAVVPPEKQLTELLRLVAPDVDDTDAQATVFALLRAVVARQFVVPEIYDVMDRVAELLVASHEPQVREVCRALYLQFLLDYPQGRGRLRNQLQFLAKNVAYAGESGRLSVLELLNAVLAKFSADVVSEYADLFFMAFVMDLANDDAGAVRKQTAHVLRVLFSAVHAPTLDALLRMAAAWAAAPRVSPQATQLAAVALHVYEIAAHARPDALAHAVGALPTICDILADAAAAMDGDADKVESQWRVCYHALQTLLVLAQHDARRVYGSVDVPTVVSLLMYPHAWVRIAAARVLGAVFAARDVPHGVLVSAARQLVRQLHSAALDDALVLQVVRNLVYIGGRWQGSAEGAQEGEGAEGGGDGAEGAPGGAESDDEPDESDDEPDESDDEPDESDDEPDESDDEPDKSADEQGESVDERAETDYRKGDGAPPGEHSVKDPSHPTPPRSSRALALEENPLAWLFSKLSHLVRQSREVGSQVCCWPHAQLTGQATASMRTGAVLKWFAAMATKLEEAQIEAFLPHMLAPLQRVEDDTSEQYDDALRTLASEVQELIQSRVSSRAFTRAYAQVRQKALARRRERRQARLFAGVADPEAAARRRASRNVAKHASRKRKNASSRDTKRHGIKKRPRA